MNPNPTERPPSATLGDPSVWPYMYGLGTAFGEMRATMDDIKVELKEINAKLDDLIKWKTMILGGVAVIVALSGALAYVSAKYSISFTERPVIVIPTSR